MTGSPTAQTQPVDGTDEQSNDAAEAAIAAAIATLLIAWLVHPHRPGRAADRRRQVDSAVGPPVRSLMQRSAFGTYQHAGQPSTPAADTVEATYPEVMTRLGDWIDQTFNRLAAGSASATAPEIHTAADDLARSIATDASGAVREKAASKLGAIWSEWVSRHDDRVRSSHADLDGQRIPFGSHFVTPAGVLIKRPGDPDAPLSETLGCRCHLRYRIRPHGETDYAKD